SDAAEFKILLGEELAPGWHWGVNGVFERTLHDELNNEWQFTAGVSRTIEDMKLSVGGEIQAIWEDTVHDRGDYEKAFFIGPSVQWHPVGRSTINLAVLRGFGSDSPDWRTFLNIGWEF
ncbi:MAG TPA: transporter, partial [Planctomycetota bacterium]|nr:transporter [Planctomycetota bacterium]